MQGRIFQFQYFREEPLRQAMSPNQLPGEFHAFLGQIHRAVRYLYHGSFNERVQLFLGRRGRQIQIRDGYGQKAILPGLVESFEKLVDSMFFMNFQKPLLD